MINWQKILLEIFFHFFSKNFLKFFSIFIPKPWLKRPKMGSNDLKSQFWPNWCTFEKLDFSLIWPYMASNQAKTDYNGLNFDFWAKKIHLSTFGFSWNSTMRPLGASICAKTGPKLNSWIKFPKISFLQLILELANRRHFGACKDSFGN